MNDRMTNFAPTVKGWKEVDSEIDIESMECDISVTRFSTNTETVDWINGEMSHGA